jgi:hypothetical protein
MKKKKKKKKKKKRMKKKKIGLFADCFGRMTLDWWFAG